MLRSLGLAVALTACVVPPLDPTAKRCSASCPDGFACEAGICVPVGGQLCAVWPDPAHACLDFEDKGGLGAPDITLNGWVRRDASGRRFGQGSLEVAIDAGSLSYARLSIPVQGAWRRIDLAYDVRAELPASDTNGSSYGEILCSHPEVDSFSGLWLFHEGMPASWFAYPNNVPDSGVPLARGPASTLWTRVELSLERAPNPGGTVRIDGQVAGTVPFSDCGGAWSVEVGMSGKQPGSAWYDDVVATVER